MSTVETTPKRSADRRVERLNTASLTRVVEPEEQFDFASLGAGQVLPDELLSVAGLDLDLTSEQLARLSREEAASMLSIGVSFEAVLTAGFSMQIAYASDATDPRLAYMLHEIGEETRHSRAFLRLVHELQPRARNPLRKPVPRLVMRAVVRMLVRSPALLCVMILAGEEIPDQFQELAADHPGTDPLIAEVNRYHRMEEARHLAFARLTLPELYGEAGALERLRIRHLAPRLIRLLFDAFVHPGVYATVGLPPMETWRAANRTPERVHLRHTAIRPIVDTMVTAGILVPGRIPAAWRDVAGVDRHGRPCS